MTNGLNYDTASVGVAILSGGKSSRMGRDKAQLVFGGESFLEHIMKEFSVFGEKFLSVAKAGDRDGSAATGWRVVPDRFPDCGPLGGIASCLNECSSSWLFVLSCDIPRCSAEFPSFLLERVKEDADIVVPVTPDGRKHMTAALYNRSIYSIMEKQLACGNYRLRDLCGKCRTVYVPVEAEAYVRMLFNVNTPQEYRMLCGEENDAGKM